MIDAYTIGITLALDDRVSAGVAAIAKDLAALDRAIDASTLRLTELRRAAGDAVSVARLSPPARVAGRHVSPVSAEPAPATTPTIHAVSRDMPAPRGLPALPIAGHVAPAAMPPHRDTVHPLAAPAPKPAPPVAPCVVVATHIAPPAPSPAAPVVVVPPAVMSAVPAPVPQRATAEPGASVVHIVQPTAPPPPAAPLPAPPAPVAPTRQPEPLLHPAVPIAPVPPSPVFDLSAFAQKMAPSVAGPAAQPLEASSSSAPPWFRLTLDHPAPVSPGHGPDERAPRILPRRSEEGSSRRAAAVGLEQRGLHGAAAAPAIFRPAAPPAAAVPLAQGPGGGDVFLDGVRVGHWLSRHLDHAATRPPAGTTGFDPRLSPSWAGATVSN